MNYFTTQLGEMLIKNDFNLEESCRELVRSSLESAINELLRTELTAVLQYERYERSDSDNSRNGSYARDFSTAYGVLHLSIPRDRNNEFHSPVVPRYGRHDGTTESTVLKLFQTGLTTSEISDIVEALYEKKYSRGTISSITDQVVANIDKFKQRQLRPHYAVIYTDATYICLRRDTVAREAVYIALGVTPEGNKEILGYRIAPTESCEVWRELLEDLRSRGLRKANLFCTDGLAGFPNVVEELFEGPRIQRCLIHVMRNIASKVRVRERKEICDGFKAVYAKPSRDEAEKALSEFLEKWRRYPSLRTALEGNPYLFTFYSFPEEIRPSIYNANMIEGFNKQIKRKTNRKEQFPTEESMEKVLVGIFEDYNARHMNTVHKGFGQVPSGTWD